jgi:hypothetical protein
VPKQAHYGPLFALVVTAAVWWGALSTWFTADDIVSLSRAAHLEPTPWVFRPLSAVLAWRFEYALFGLRPLGYHLVALALHGLNVWALYSLALRLGSGRGVATGTALLFGASGIAFTVLHAASGIGDLLALLMVLLATRVHLHARDRADSGGLWLASAIASLAVLAKESALAWPIVIVGIECLGVLSPPASSGGVAVPRARLVLPAIASGILGAAWTFGSMGSGGMSPIGAYGVTLAPLHLLANLSTYLRWIASVGVPMRDWIALPDRTAIPVGLLTLAVLAVAWVRGTSGSPQIRAGILWLLGFLLPVLPLHYHSYLYYLYLPWAGGALAVAGLLESLTSRMASRVGYAVAAVLIAGFVVAEAQAVRARERMTISGLPADRTLRDAELLRNVVSALGHERLPDSTTVGFVNPSPASAVQLNPAEPRDRDETVLRTYYPLESLLQDGKAIRLFFPTWSSAGFSDTIPAGWENVECFLFEQRGFLRRWGKGADALQRQADWIRDHGPATGPPVR